MAAIGARGRLRQRRSHLGELADERSLAVRSPLEHYRFTGDERFLRQRAYPVMKGSAEFYLDWLIQNPQGGLTTCPSFSTENSFLSPDGQHRETSAGCTMDIALLARALR